MDQRVSEQTPQQAVSLRPRNRQESRRGTRPALQHPAEYRTWANMKYRCFNPRAKQWPGYGGRGITVCDRWADSFFAFLADVGPRPSPLHSIDRFPNNNGNYEPGNCRWATSLEQSERKRSTVLVEWRGQLMPLKWAARDAEVTYECVLRRLRVGMALEEAITAPKRQSRLTDGDIIAIRESGDSQKQLAARYDIDPSHISRIRSGEYRRRACEL